jgi:hypothetical protein
MKTKLSHTVHFAKVAGLALGMGMTTLAQTDLVINTFDTEESIVGWTRWWGGAAQSYEFDPSVDANGNASSGSLKATIDFDTALSDNQFALMGAFPENAAVDGTKYIKLTFDLRWSAESPKRASGDFGYLEPGFRTTDWAQIWLTGFNVTPGDEWIRVELPINAGVAKLDIINGIVLKMWSGQTGLTGQSTFWVDNIKLVANPSTEVPKPTLALEWPQPGLRLTASGSGIYQRQNIRTTEPEFSWVGAAGPVSYSFTIRDYPSEAGFQSHIFLVPAEGLPNSQSSPDWNRPDVIFLDISNNAQGGGTANFRYKVNAPNANSMIYNGNPANGPVGALGAIGSATMKGTWTLTFNDDTTAVVTTADGSSRTYQLPAEHAALFDGPLHVFFGVQPNGENRLRKTAVFSHVKITGVQSPIDESFPGVAESEGDPVDLDRAVWTRVAESAAGIVLVPPSARYELVWTAPAAGFVLQSSPNLVDWSNVDAPATQIGDKIRSLLSHEPSPSQGFFRLVKP